MRCEYWGTFVAQNHIPCGTDGHVRFFIDFLLDVHFGDYKVTTWN